MRAAVLLLLPLLVGIQHAGAERSAPPPSLQSAFHVAFNGDTATAAHQLLSLHGLITQLLGTENVSAVHELERDLLRPLLPVLSFSQGIIAEGAHPESDIRQQGCSALPAVVQAVDQATRAIMSRPATPHAFALSRRAFMGALLACTTHSGGGGEGEAAAAVGKVLQRFYALHRRGMAAKGLLSYIHVSKAAGSAVCLLAKRNNCTTQRFGAKGGKGNCLVPRFDDIPRWISRGQHAYHFSSNSKKRQPYVRFGVLRRAQFTCAARKSIMKGSGWTFYANEYTLFPPEPGEEPGLCPEYAHLLVVRHPYARLASHLRYIKQQYERRFGESRCAVRLCEGWGVRVVQRACQPRGSRERAAPPPPAPPGLAGGGRPPNSTLLPPTPFWASAGPPS